MEDHQMINSATAQIRIAPELLQTTKEVRDVQRKEQETESASKAPEVAPQKAHFPSNPGVGGMVDVEA